jgi:glycosyltransferase involved in cell wall biosynthesis
MEEVTGEEPGLSGMPQISIVMPTYNRREIVLRSLKSLFEQDFPFADFEIIVVDDGSSDGTGKALRDISAPCRMRVIEQKNGGPGATRNAGVQVASAELILFLDDDMRCDRGLVGAHVEAHREGAKIVGYGAIFADAESPRGLALECFKREIGSFHLKQFAAPSTSWEELSYVFSNTSVRRKPLLDVHGFDESFRVREDLELGIRLHGAGARPFYVSDAIAWQYYFKTQADLLMEAERFAVADVRIGRKHPEKRMPGDVRTVLEARSWKAKFRRVLVSLPLLEKLLFSPLCVLGEKFVGIGFFRDLGARALQIRRRVRWLRTAREIIGTEIEKRR